MRMSMAALAVTTVLAGSVSGTALAYAGNVDNADLIGPPVPAPRVVMQLLDCGGTTGVAGCGPGWHWRDGWRGRGCYPC